MADPETAHGLALESLRIAHTTGATRLLCKSSDLPRKVMGLEFPNPVGMAAGMDKNGDYIDPLGGLGFGFIEIGTVTPRSQPGNPKPRVFRLEKSLAMINRLGFNNKGVDHLVQQARQRIFPGILGINIGKNFDTPIENAAEDYLLCMQKVYPVADYITVNISSPNTVGLRELQTASQLDLLLAVLQSKRQSLEQEYEKRVPLVVKVAPDLEDNEIPEIATIVRNCGFDGLIATNTTISRDEIKDGPQVREQGGLSGKPLQNRANEVLSAFRNCLPTDIALIGVGDVCSGEDAAEKMRLGADLIQFYTGFVYRGPQLVNDCLQSLGAHQGNA